MAAKPRQNASRTYAKHGLTALKRAVKSLGGRLIDRRTALGKALAQWRADLVADLGGVEAVSTQQLAVVELAVRTKLLLDSIDVWLLQQPALVDKRARRLLPAVRERQALADALSRYMGQLGLERRQAPPKSLEQYLAERAEAQAAQRSESQPERPPETGP